MVIGRQNQETRRSCIWVNSFDGWHLLGDSVTVAKFIGERILIGELFIWDIFLSNKVEFRLNLKMGMSSSDMAAMYTLLMNSMSGDEGVRKQAEKALSDTDSRSGFCSCLLELITSPDLVSQADIRLMASVYLKNSINRYWRMNSRRTLPNIWSSQPVLSFLFFCFWLVLHRSHSYGI